MSLATLPCDWDVVVVGAGVAGSVIAYRLARRGLRVLLAEKTDWPRDKACGGCINAAALRALGDAGLADVARAGPAYARMRLASGQHQAILPLPRGRAVSRRTLDALLVERAVDAGVRFLPDAQALLAPDEGDRHWRHLRLRHGRDEIALRARLVIGGDGLGSRLLREDAPEELDVDAGSRIGVGATLDAAPSDYSPGTIHMACARHGYVGLVRVENGRLNVGAALDPVWVKQCGGPAAAVTDVLRSANFPVFAALHEANWHGTPRLTRRRSRLGAERVLVVGDAAGYVEPFTGEGMGWALAGAAALEPLALDAVEAWRDDLVERWTARHGEVIRTRQRGCRSIAALLRRPRLIAAALPLIDTAPGVVAPLTAWLNRAYNPDPVEEK